MKKSIVAIVLLAGLIAYGAYDVMHKSASSSEPSAETGETGLVEGIGKGQLAPDFTLNDLQGNPVSLADYKGKLVLVNFWATWCPPCRVEMPHMQKFYEDYSQKDVVVLGVNLTPTERNPDAVEPFVKDREITFPVVLDKKGDAMQAYQVIAYPTTYLLDAKGVIREKFQGAIDYDMMKKAVSKWK